MDCKEAMKVLFNLISVVALLFVVYKAPAIIGHGSSILSYMSSREYIESVSKNDFYVISSSVKRGGAHEPYPDGFVADRLERLNKLSDQIDIGFGYFDGLEYSHYFISENNFLNQNYHIRDGRPFDNYDYDIKDNRVPVIIGENLLGKYRLGGEYGIDFQEDSNIRMVVVGVFDASTSFNSLSELDATMRNAVVFPWSRLLRDHYFLSNPGEMLQGAVLRTRHIKEVEDIIEEINKYGIVELSLGEVKGEISSYYDEYLYPTVTKLIIIIIIFMSSVSFLSYSILSWNRSRKQIDVRK